MLSELRLVYWDACVPLAYINGEAARLPHLEGLLQESGKDFQIITSVYSVVEVAFAKAEQDEKQLDKDTEEKISKLWLAGSRIQLVEFYELIAQRAVALVRAAIPKQWTLKPGDAIHLATADHLKVSEFHTYDDKLDKFQELTDTHFTICRPIARQPVLITSSTPSKEERSVENKEELPKTATQVAATVQRSGSGHPESQAGAKTEESKAPEK